MTSVPTTETVFPSTAVPARRWTARRILAISAGVVVALCAVVVLICAVAAASWDAAGRHGGYLTLDSVPAGTGRGVLLDPAILRDEVGTSDRGILSLFGTARIRVTSSDPAQPIFIGIARPGAASALLATNGYTTFRDTAHGVVSTTHDGPRPEAALNRSAAWLSSASGTGPLAVTAPAEDAGELVVTSTDGSTHLAITVDLEASVPGLPWLAAGLGALGVILLIGGGLLVLVPARNARRA